jgi:hypothetical protein
MDLARIIFVYLLLLIILSSNFGYGYVKDATRPFLYINDQPEITTHDRSIVVDWIIEVHMQIRGLVPESLYLCVSIIDRFLSRKCVPRNWLSLLGITSLLIACKYEQTEPTKILDYTEWTDYKYTRQEVRTMELLILTVLDYRLTVPTGYTFLQRFLHITNADGVAANLASFYLERTLLEYSALDLRPSHIAAAAVSLALNNPDVPTVPTIPGVVSTTNASMSTTNSSSIYTFSVLLSSPNHC